MVPATRPALGTDGLTKLTRQIIDRFDPNQRSTDDEKLERTEALSWSTTPTGMTRLVAELSPVNAAILKEAITAKSAPRPAKPTDDTDGSALRLEGDGKSLRDGLARDERSPGKRRVDALLDLVSAGARVAAGDSVQAGAARRFACTADLIPVVLGGPSQPLDVGRRERLATKAIRAATILRDQGCSFPGCDRPPGFCEIHHVRPWWAGGETSLANSALLCGRHHQTVHRQGYTADVRADGVSWDLTPGGCPATNSRPADPPPDKHRRSAPDPTTSSIALPRKRIRRSPTATRPPMDRSPVSWATPPWLNGWDKP